METKKEAHAWLLPHSHAPQNSHTSLPELSNGLSEERGAPERGMGPHPHWDGLEGRRKGGLGHEDRFKARDLNTIPNTPLITCSQAESD